MTGIYCIKNTINNMVYVGRSTNIKKRWRTHKEDLRANKHHNTYLQHAWNKYGENAFVFEVLEECKEKYLNDRETMWKNRFDLLSGTYNLGVTGNAHNMSEETKAKMIKTLKQKHLQVWLGRHHTEETIRKLSIASKKQWEAKTEEEKNTIIKRLANANKGKHSWIYGKHLSLETKKKLSELNKGKVISQWQKDRISAFNKGKVYSNETIEKMRNTYKNKGCVQIDKNGNVISVYRSIKEAHRQTKIEYTSIAKACKGNTRTKTAGGYCWKYVN